MTGELNISNQPMISSNEISVLVESRHDKVKQSIERLAGRGVITLPPMGEKVTGGRPATFYIFEGTQGKRDSIIVVAQLCPEFTARLVDRWQELEQERLKPKSQAELNLAYAQVQVEQERRLNHVEEKIADIEERVSGAVPAGWQGYTQLVATSGLSKQKCRDVVRAFSVSHKSILFMTPVGIPSNMEIVNEWEFNEAVIAIRRMAERRGSQWYHPKIGRFQAVGWD